MFGVSEYHYIIVCKSKIRDIFLGVLYGYKALLQVIALILTFTTRKVKVKGLNDAIYIAGAIYVTSLIWAVVIVSTYSLREYLNVFTVVFSLGLFVGPSVIMALVFIPKVGMITVSGKKRAFSHFLLVQMVSLHKDPKGETVFTSSVQSSKAMRVTGNWNGEENCNHDNAAVEISTLRKRVAELEQALQLGECTYL